MESLFSAKLWKDVWTSFVAGSTFEVLKTLVSPVAIFATAVLAVIAPRCVRRRRARTIAVVMNAAVRNSFLQKFCHGLFNCLSDRGMSIRLVSVNGDTQSVVSGKLRDADGCGGVIVIPAFISVDALGAVFKELAHRKLPVVCVDDLHGGLQGFRNTVMTRYYDNAKAAADVMDAWKGSRFREAPYRLCLQPAARDDDAPEARVSEIRARCIPSGSFRPEPSRRECRADVSTLDAYLATWEWLRGLPDDGQAVIVCANDDIAVGAFEAVARAVAGRDVLIVAYDRIVADKTPAASTVSTVFAKQDPVLLAREAASCLESAMEGRALDHTPPLPFEVDGNFLAPPVLPRPPAPAEAV